jgi:hypothetical protein
MHEEIAYYMHAIPEPERGECVEGDEHRHRRAA